MLRMTPITSFSRRVQCQSSTTLTSTSDLANTRGKFATAQHRDTTESVKEEKLQASENKQKLK